MRFGVVAAAMTAVMLGCASQSAVPTITAGPTASPSAQQSTGSPSDSPPTPSQTAAPSPTDTPAGASPTPRADELPSPVTPLEPGRYTKSAFVPRLSFEVGSGWSAAQSTRGFFDIQDDPGSLDVVAVQFANIPSFATAEAAAASVAARPNVAVNAREDVELAGLPAIRLEVDTTDPADTEPPIFRDVIVAAPGPLAIASGRRLQLSLLDTPSGVLAVLVGGSIANWDDTLATAQPVLDSIVIDAS